MNEELEYSSYNRIKRLSDEELEQLWHDYLADKSQKELRDKLIVQYIYLTRYVIGRVKMNLPQTFSLEDIRVDYSLSTMYEDTAFDPLNYKVENSSITFYIEYDYIQITIINNNQFKIFHRLTNNRLYCLF